MGSMLPRLAAASRAADPPVRLYVGVAPAIAAERAGRLGLPLSADSTMTAAELRTMLDAYNQAAATAGVTPPAAHALQRDVFVTDDRERDWAALLPELRYMRRQYGGGAFPQGPAGTGPARLDPPGGGIQGEGQKPIPWGPAKGTPPPREVRSLRGGPPLSRRP